MGDSLEKTIKSKWDKGYPKFEKLFNSSSAEIQEKLSSCKFQEDIIKSLKEKQFSVIKEIHDDVPWEINLWYYDKIAITPFGIQFKPEHGPVQDIADFSVDF